MKKSRPSPNGKPARLSAEEFVRLYQAAESYDELSATTGMLKTTLYTRAQQYRRNGVPLKRIPSRRGPRADWAALAKLAAELNPEA